MDELQRQARLAGPLYLQNVFSYALNIIAIAFIGNLNDPVLLSSAVLATTLFNASGLSIVVGLSAGMETLCGQAYGARNHCMLGVVLQRALLLVTLFALAICVLWGHMEPLLLALGQQPGIAAGAARYLCLIRPCILLMGLIECLKRYLMAQRVVLPGMVTTVATTLLAPAYNYVLMFRMRLGIDGAAYAFVAAQATSAALMLGYVVGRDWARRTLPDRTFDGFTTDALRGWGTYLSFALPSTAMVVAEWWCFEVVIFLAGAAQLRGRWHATVGQPLRHSQYGAPRGHCRLLLRPPAAVPQWPGTACLLPNAGVAVGVMGLTLQVSAFSYMSALAFATSTCTRVANELGAAAPAAARLAVMTGTAVVAMTQIATACAVLACARSIVSVLTSTGEVRVLMLRLMPVMAPTLVADGINCVTQAVLRATGRPGLGAMLNLVGYWAVGVPLAAVLGLRSGLNVTGFWIGLLVATSLQAVLQLAIISRFDWQLEARRAEALVFEHANCGEAGGGKATAGSSSSAMDVGADGDLADEERPLLLHSTRTSSRSLSRSLSLPLPVSVLAGWPMQGSGSGGGGMAGTPSGGAPPAARPRPAGEAALVPLGALSATAQS